MRRLLPPFLKYSNEKQHVTLIYKTVPEAAYHNLYGYISSGSISNYIHIKKIILLKKH